MSDKIRAYWPIFIAVVISAASYAGTVATVNNTKEDVKELKATYVTKEILDLKLLPLREKLERIIIKLDA